MLYDTSNNLESVELTSSTRRALAQEEYDVAAIEGRRLDFDSCTACEDAWDALCAGVTTSLCDLADYGPPFSATAAASVDTTCETFGRACSSYDASEACEGQCPDEGVYDHQMSFLRMTYEYMPRRQPVYVLLLCDSWVVVDFCLVVQYWRGPRHFWRQADTDVGYAF